MKKLFFENKDEITIAFIGGSITQGSAANEYSKCYVSLVGEYFKSKFPKKKINIINAGVGGTNSFLGAFRLAHDVISHNPDMVFVEFAVNDIETPSETVVTAMQSIVVQLLKMDTVPAVFFIYTTTSQKTAVDFIHEKVAKYYGIPSCNIQEHIWERVNKGEFGILDIMPDGVHPNDKGHSIYADCIISTIESGKFNAIKAPDKRDKELVDYTFNNPRLVSYKGAKATGNVFIKNINIGKIDNVIILEKEGDSLEFTFNGTAIGLYHMACKDGGIMNIYIDDEFDQQVDTYKNMNVPYSQYQKIGLKNCLHRIKVSATGEKNKLSTDSKIKIAYFTVEG